MTARRSDGFAPVEPLRSLFAAADPRGAFATIAQRCRPAVIAVIRYLAAIRSHGPACARFAYRHPAIECLIEDYLHLRPLLIDRYAEAIEELRQH